MLLKGINKTFLKHLKRQNFIKLQNGHMFYRSAVIQSFPNIWDK